VRKKGRQCRPLLLATDVHCICKLQIAADSRLARKIGTEEEATIANFELAASKLAEVAEETVAAVRRRCMEHVKNRRLRRERRGEPSGGGGDFANVSHSLLRAAAVAATTAAATAAVAAAAA